MKRDRTSFLIEWLNSNTRKPLVIRGARQVGKTWLIQDLARSQQRRLIEFNFEKRPDLETLFASNDPKEILAKIEKDFGKGTIMRLGDTSSLDIEVIPTGCLTLDVALVVESVSQRNWKFLDISALILLRIVSNTVEKTFLRKSLRWMRSGLLGITTRIVSTLSFCSLS